MKSKVIVGIGATATKAAERADCFLRLWFLEHHEVKFISTSLLARSYDHVECLIYILYEEKK